MVLDHYFSLWWLRLLDSKVGSSLKRQSHLGPEEYGRKDTSEAVTAQKIRPWYLVVQKKNAESIDVGIVRRYCWSSSRV